MKACNFITRRLTLYALDNTKLVRTVHRNQENSNKRGPSRPSKQ